LADRLVAVTHECDFPPDAIAGIPRITGNIMSPEVTSSAEIDAAVRAGVASGHGLYTLDEALLTQLEPDLLLTQELCRVCAVAYPTVLQAARAAGGSGGPMIVSLEPHTIADIAATIRLVAGLAGVEQRGEVLLDEFERRLEAVDRPDRRPGVAVIEWLDPPFAPGHWVPEQVERAGGRSVFGGAGERSQEAAWQDLAAADPEVMVLGLCGFDLPRTLEEWAAFDPPAPLLETRAWDAGNVWGIDGSAYVSRPGPRVVEGVEIIAGILASRPDRRARRLPTEART
jgi:iron complex transport system substrate-binding protein